MKTVAHHRQLEEIYRLVEYLRITYFYFNLNCSAGSRLLGAFCVSNGWLIPDPLKIVKLLLR